MERLNEVNDHLKDSGQWNLLLAASNLPHFYVYAHIHRIVTIVLLCNDFIAIYWNLSRLTLC